MAGPQARQPPQLRPRFPDWGREQGGYESVYLRAVHPTEPRGVWLRHTIHKAPGEAPVGSVWSVTYDPTPTATKVSLPDPGTPWIQVGDSVVSPDGVSGPHAQLTWEVADPEPLRHLPREWMYRAPLPRTKSESPLPSLRFSGRVGDVELDGWPGMLGHNWGDQHAERWIWLHGVFDDGDWLDVVIGRVKVGPILTPWIANGAVSCVGTRHRVSGRARVAEDALGAHVEVGELVVDVRSQPDRVVVWRYADPGVGGDGVEHHTANGSVATLTATLGGRRLHTPHGGVYELGMREQDHGLVVLPFTDP